MSDKYILNSQGEPEPCDDLHVWARSFETDRRVARDEINGRIVSTVFLGIDHNFNGGEPLIWETMVFPSEDNFNEEDADRCGGSRADAQAMHNRMVAKVKDRQQQPEPEPSTR